MRVGVPIVTALITLISPLIALSSITPNSIDLAAPPANFTITGEGYSGAIDLPVVNFIRNGLTLGQARANSLNGSTSLTVPFPTNGTTLIGPLPGLSIGSVSVQVYNQTGPGTYNLVDSNTLTVVD